MIVWEKRQHEHHQCIHNCQLPHIRPSPAGHRGSSRVGGEERPPLWLSFLSSVSGCGASVGFVSAQAQVCSKCRTESPYVCVRADAIRSGTLATAKGGQGKLGRGGSPRDASPRRTWELPFRSDGDLHGWWCSSRCRCSSGTEIHLHAVFCIEAARSSASS